MDRTTRRLLEPPLARTARILDRPWLHPNHLTAMGLVVGLSVAVAAGLQSWQVALVLWLLSRLADGLDGALARHRAAAGAPMSGAGGFLDITADFVVYGSTVLGVAFGVSRGFDAPLWPFLLVLFAYYVKGSSLLAFSSIAEKAGRPLVDGRSLSFPLGFAGATETILVHSLWLLFPAHAWSLAIVWAAVVLADAARQIVSGYRLLS
ncbi:MAG: Transmembrane protein [uncultured Thermomicrobiales bacterium]|uniref:Transmembrane protein n=1 Tax=uncultured Thermomicrobiales bacterium TaxID=1645740 RepID=A0A6J4V9V5_9BACT|nr:MAG: Transmembrane protein [uncultured Thermomicrobiales bacterium]